MFRDGICSIASHNLLYVRQELYSLFPVRFGSLDSNVCCVPKTMDKCIRNIRTFIWFPKVIRTHNYLFSNTTVFSDNIHSKENVIPLPTDLTKQIIRSCE